jgi:hypothetical protein
MNALRVGWHKSHNTTKISALHIIFAMLLKIVRKPERASM